MKRFYLLHHLDYIQKPDEEEEQSFVDSILGRVVKEYNEPARNYASVARTAENAAALTTGSTAFKELRQLLSKSKSLKVKLLLQQLVGLEYETSTLADQSMTGGIATYHFFKYDEAIDFIRRDAGIKPKLENWLARGGSKVWVITGLIMAQTVDAGNSSQRTRTTKATVDPAAALSPNTSAKMEASAESARQQLGEAKVSKLSVVAVRYTCLQRKRFSRDPGLVTKLKAGRRISRLTKGRKPKGTSGRLKWPTEQSRIS